MGQATFTFRVDAELKDNFATIAKTLDRSGAQLLRDYMRDIVRRQQDAAQHDIWFRDQVQHGIAAANAGDVVSAEEVETEAAAWREETLRKMNSNQA